jgi:hypothetical protein
VGALLAVRGGWTYGIDKSREVQEDAVECDNAHALQWVCVDDVGADCRIAHLDARSEEEECDLADWYVMLA